MSAIGTDRLCRPLGKQVRCWRLTGCVAAVLILLCLTHCGRSASRLGSNTSNNCSILGRNGFTEPTEKRAREARHGKRIVGIRRKCQHTAVAMVSCSWPAASAMSNTITAATISITRST